jgi:hypothetical protein
MQKVITVEHIQRNGTPSVIEQRVTEYPPVVKMIEEGWRAVAVSSTSSDKTSVCFITIIMEKP